jgi:hypothetical protein
MSHASTVGSRYLIVMMKQRRRQQVVSDRHVAAFGLQKSSSAMPNLTQRLSEPLTRHNFLSAKHTLRVFGHSRNGQPANTGGGKFNSILGNQASSTHI